MLLKKISSALVICVLSVNFSAVQAQEGVKVVNKKMAIEVTLNSSNELKIVIQESMDKEILDVTKVKGYQISESIYYEEEFESKPRIIAYTLIPDQGKKGNKEKKVAVTHFPVEDYLADGVFYSGTKRYLVNYPHVQNGAILHYESEYILKEPHLLPTFFFDHYLSCDVSELTITVGKGVELGTLDFFRGQDTKISQSETTLSNGFEQFQWRGEDFSPRKYEDDAGGISCTSPHTVIRIKSYMKEDEKIRILEDKDDLFRWYSSLVSDYTLQSRYTPIVDSLKASSSEPLVVAENIFNWVQHNVKYIAYEDGFGGFVPRDPSSVIHNRYGDCKDMAMLTKTLMNACGLDCYVAWVGTRDKCYTYNSCPTPVTDNHMIAVFPMGDKFLFLDPTSAYSEFGKPSAFIQGKEAMIRKNSKEFEVMLIEEIEAEENYNIDSLTIEIDGNNLIGTGTNRLGGYEKIEFEYALDYSDQSVERLFAKFLGLGNESFGIAQLKQTNTDSNKGEILSTYNFNLKNYVHQFENHVIFVPFVKAIPMGKISDRKYDMDLSYKCYYRTVVRLNIPEGYNVIRLPERSKLNENGIQFEINVEHTNNEIIITQSFSRNTLTLSTVQMIEVNKTLKTINKLIKQSIELENEKL